MYPNYSDMLGNFDSIDDMCNQLGLNYDDVFDYDNYENEDSDD